MSPITSHVLDTALGKPARGITVVIEIGQRARPLDRARPRRHRPRRPDRSIHPDLSPLEPGLYRLRFFTAAYFTAMGSTASIPRSKSSSRSTTPPSIITSPCS